MSTIKLTCFLLLLAALLIVVGCGGGAGNSPNTPNNGGNSPGPGGTGTPGSGQSATYVYARTLAGQISGYGLNADGSLVSLSGSPFSLPGGQMAASGSHLFSAGPSELLVFGIEPQTGALTSQSQAAVPGATFVAAQDNAVYVTGTGPTGDFVVYGFSVAPNGALTPIPGTPVALSSACELCASPSSITISSAYLVVGLGGGEHSAGAFIVYARQGNGGLQRTSGVGGDSMLSVSLHPSNRYLYAVQGGVGDILVSTIDSSGTAQVVQSLAPATSFFVFAAVDPSGTYLVGGSYADELISFPVNTDGTLGAEAARTQANVTNATFVFDPSGRFILAASSVGVTVFSFNNTNGALGTQRTFGSGNTGLPVVVRF